MVKVHLKSDCIDKEVEIRTLTEGQPIIWLKYFYRFLELHPAVNILATPAGILDYDRDGYELTKLWLQEVTGEKEWIENNMEDMNSPMLFDILDAFKKVNSVEDFV